ncbi:hypothetical protein [Krasilnikovia sp. MM14-A1259]|uniref:hypothetical protein n=1 Tax=Krasilnikovia sp. MM14-A1259 TaxID=3373539 RepID=UPI0038178A9E
MSITRRRLVAAAAALACVTVCAAAAGFRGIGPLARLSVTEMRLEPQIVTVMNPPADPLEVLVGVTWREEGYCAGQFEVRATETPTEVRVGTVVSRDDSALSCAGIGTVDNLAWAELQIAAPLGTRAVVRGSDGSVLPIRYR